MTPYEKLRDTIHFALRKANDKDIEAHGNDPVLAARLDLLNELDDIISDIEEEFGEPERLSVTQDVLNDMAEHLRLANVAYANEAAKP